jgi:hypothetical protein
MNEHVGEQRDEAAGDVGGGDSEGGTMGSVGGGFFEAELEAHHEIDPCGGVLFQRVQDRGGAGAVDGILLEYLVDLLLFVVGAFDDLALFAEALGDVVLGVATGREIAAETHGDGASGDFGEAGEDYDVGRGDRSGETGGEGEGDSEAVGEADDDVADSLSGLEVALYVGVVGVGRGLGRSLTVGDLVHGGSVVQAWTIGRQMHADCGSLGWERVFRIGGTSV